jgi:hypothetical protein
MPKRRILGQTETARGPLLLGDPQEHHCGLLENTPHRADMVKIRLEAAMHQIPRKLHLTTIHISVLCFL